MRLVDMRKVGQILRVRYVIRDCLFDHDWWWVGRCDIMSRDERKLEQIVRRDEISRYEKSKTEMCKIRLYGARRDEIV